MVSKAWYFGPLGDLRPLICPEEGVQRPIERFGSVHTAISGARTVDITGHKSSYELTLPWLSASESRFVEALHCRTVPGPFYLIDPLGTNRLTRQAARLDPSAITASAGGLLRTTGVPAEIGVPVTRLDWSDVATGHTLTIGSRLPVLDAETVTFSLWAASSVASDLELTLTAVDVSGATLANPTHSASLASAWQRVQLAADLPAATIVVSAFVTTTGGAIVSLAAAQVEHGAIATEWDPGGAAPCVILDQVDRISPNYPRNDLTLTLLEA